MVGSALNQILVVTLTSREGKAWGWGSTRGWGGGRKGPQVGKASVGRKVDEMVERERNVWFCFQIALSPSATSRTKQCLRVPLGPQWDEDIARLWKEKGEREERRRERKERKEKASGGEGQA